VLNTDKNEHVMQSHRFSSFVLAHRVYKDFCRSSARPPHKGPRALPGRGGGGVKGRRGPETRHRSVGGNHQPELREREMKDKISKRDFTLLLRLVLISSDWFRDRGHFASRGVFLFCVFW